MEKGTPEDQVDFIAAKIRTFQPSTGNVQENDWQWPPSQKVMNILDHYIASSSSSDIKTCFDFDEIPSPVPDSSGSSTYSQAAHCFIFAPTNDPRKGCAMMQMRFDGKLGFPGGLIDPGENVVTGLNRELLEEINLDLETHSMKREDFLFCHYTSDNKDPKSSSRIRMFFAKEVTKTEFESIEKRSLDASEYGYESLGQFRVPLYVYKDNLGLPKFLSSTCFAGGATKAQLLLAMYAKKLITFEELKYVHEKQMLSAPDVGL